ncbi:MAG TPA: glutamate-1-semialdehyde 2,1-aminomutase [Steroidobacteraceae bacterium]|nr:glutamate-1-semialdehyde 2,1-aminomutase [Steroidobacteraceae bacterium]
MSHSADATTRQQQLHPRSLRLYERASLVIPGGVNSPVRAFRAVGGTPLFFVKGKGAYLTDADGRSYLDLVCSWGPLILGHAHPQVVEAVAQACREGTTFGAPCPAEVELAERVVASYPGIEQVRLVSSGTEAVMSAIRLSRAFTGRDLIVKFSGCYHGHADHLLVAAGSGLATFGRPSSAGVPDAFTACTRVLPLDDEAAVDALFSRDGERIAAVIVEPLPANHGLLPQRQELLERLRAVTREHGALLIFDEVISGFRLARGGAAERLGIVPDLATFGKVIGGGMPVGAFAGPRRIMARLAPDGDTYQAGTLSGNPVAMASGIATLDVLGGTNGWEQLEALGVELERLLQPILEEAPFPIHLVRVGSLFWLSMHESGAPRTAVTLSQQAVGRFAALFHAMLAQGIYLPPSAYEACFLSLAHTTADLERLAQGLRTTLAGLR